MRKRLPVTKWQSTTSFLYFEMSPEGSPMLRSWLYHVVDQVKVRVSAFHVVLVFEGFSKVACTCSVFALALAIPSRQRARMQDSLVKIFMMR